jgi:hypothetical protein
MRDGLPSSLRDAIDGLYRAFARYPQPATSDRSPYANITDEVVAQLHAAPLRDLTPAQVERYSRHAMTTWGDEFEFRHYLPRVFELMALDPWWTEVSLLIGKLHDGRWLEWPEPERQSVLAFLDALWRWSLESNPHVVRTGNILRGIGLAGLDLTAYIADWRRTRSATAVQQLAELILLEERELLEGGSVASFWHPKDRPAVNALVMSPETRQLLEDAYLAAPDAPGARDLARAADVLHRIGY